MTNGGMAANTDEHANNYPMILISCQADWCIQPLLTRLLVLIAIVSAGSLVKNAQTTCPAQNSRQNIYFDSTLP